jgi:hypothetical protein
VLLCWDVRLGAWRSLPIAVLTASWVAQAHVVALPMLLVVGAGTAGLCVLDQRRRDERTRRRFARGRTRALVASAVLGLFLSVPMLVDQVWGAGNLGKLLSFAGEQGQGAGFAARSLIVAFGAPPAWLQPTNDPFALLRTPRTIDVAVFAGTAALFVWVALTARRRNDRVTASLLDAGLLCVAGGAVILIRTPVRGAVLAADPMLVLHPATAIVGLGLGWGCWQMVADRVLPHLEQPRVRWGATAFGALAALVVISATASAPERFGGFGDGLMAPLGAMQPQIEQAVDGEAMVQVNATGWAARLYLRHGIIEDLERHGISTKTGDTERPLRRSGSERGAPTATLWVVTDPVEPVSPSPDAVLIARGELSPGGGQSDQARRRSELRDLIDAAGTVTLTDSDQFSVADVSREYFRWKEPPEANRLPAGWVSVDAFVDLAQRGLVASPEVDPDLIHAIARDSIGQYFATADMEVAVYLRQE